MSIPDDIKIEHLLQAAKAIDGGGVHNFAESTKFDAIVNGRRYAPKALIGIAAEYATGTRLEPGDFSSGESRSQAVGFLRRLGVEVVRKHGRWWVNQNQTYREEIEGGYLWSPKRNKNGARNQFYENMRAVSPGDRIYSFRNTRIVAVGIAISYCYDSPKPTEFGRKGDNWDATGWKVDIEYTELPNPIRPKDHIDQIRPTLPEKYSPLQQSGDGLQSVYLAEVNYRFASVLDKLLKTAGNQLPTIPAETGRPQEDSVAAFEDFLESHIDVGPTEKEQLVKARKGQGRFRANVQAVESRCRVTSVIDPQFLIASHIKPWRHSTNEERLDGENGLLLTPNIDRLFDKGFISFADDGTLIVSPVADRASLALMGIPDQELNCGRFTERQRFYLSYHRRNLLLDVGSGERD